MTVTVPCFARGTRIATEQGEIAVEALCAGDRVTTLSGSSRPIIWVGSGRTLVTPRNRCDVAPVIVRAGAIADGMPSRDLVVTRRHAMLVGDVLVPVEHLINNVSIVWDERAQMLEYFHLELDTHDILLANGAPAESFRDDESARWFQNTASRTAAHHPPPPCRRVVESGPALDAAWAHLAARAGTSEALPAVPLWTEAADLHLIVDGRRIDPGDIIGNHVLFALPTTPHAIAIGSRMTIPAAAGIGADSRRLGVAVTGLSCDAAETIRLDDPALDDTMYHFGGDHRWTSGASRLPKVLFPAHKTPMELEIRIIPLERYQVPRPRESLALSA